MDLSLMRRGNGASGAPLDKQTIGNALVVHPAAGMTEEAQALALGVAADTEHDLVVVDLPVDSPISMWESVAKVLPRRRRGVRLVIGGRSRETTALAGQWLAERINRTVLAPDGSVIPNAGGTLFVHSGRGSGWVKFQPGRPPKWEAKRFPRPSWDSGLTAELTSTSSRGVAEPLPGGLWVRPVGFDQQQREHRGALARGLPAQRDTMTIVLGCPGCPPLTLDDVARLWARLPENVRANTRFVQYGPMSMPGGSTLGQALADLLGRDITFYPGLPVVAAQAIDVRTVLFDGRLGWTTFVREVGYQPRTPQGSPAPRLLDHRSPINGLDEISPAVYWYAPDAVIEVVQSGLLVRPPQDGPDTPAVRTITLDNSVNNLTFDAPSEDAVDRMRLLAEDVLARLDEHTRAMSRVLPAGTLIAERSRGQIRTKALGEIEAGAPVAPASVESSSTEAVTTSPYRPADAADLGLDATSEPSFLRAEPTITQRLDPDLGASLSASASAPISITSARLPMATVEGTTAEETADGEPSAPATGSVPAPTPAAALEAAPVSSAASALDAAPVPTAGPALDAAPAPAPTSAPAPAAAPAPTSTSALAAAPAVALTSTLAAPAPTPATPAPSWSTSAAAPSSMPAPTTWSGPTGPVPSTPAPQRLPASNFTPPNFTPPNFSTPPASSLRPSSSPVFPLTPPAPIPPAMPPAGMPMASAPPATPAAGMPMTAAPPATPPAGMPPVAAGPAAIPAAGMPMASAPPATPPAGMPPVAAAPAVPPAVAPASLPVAELPGLAAEPKTTAPEPIAAPTPAAPTPTTATPATPATPAAGLVTSGPLTSAAGPVTTAVGSPAAPSAPASSGTPGQPATPRPTTSPTTSPTTGPTTGPTTSPNTQRQTTLQPTPGPESTALLPKRGVDKEREWLRKSLGAEYGLMSNSVARILSEHPGFQGALSTSSVEVLTDAVAVQLYLSAKGTAIDAGLRSGVNGPHVPIARCVVAGLSRLPSHRGPATFATSLSDAATTLYRTQKVLTEWGFLNTLTQPSSTLDGDTDVLVWSITARRTKLLEPAEAGVDNRVLFVPGTSFKVLELREPGDGARGLVLLRELTTSEVDETGKVASDRISLDELALVSLRRELEAWAEAEGRRPMDKKAAQRFTALPGLV
ncbi:hypothetical protein [Amycolatopsis saalfeldensis]|uniref:Uncharacterized protein n=1 Tax=Amycolatopsis saalfeldensis TaxID=394193 RepID=A0A1H8YJR9_9PSEU|nr:hypothetical protein [Amycolatopsis saalfeldensis]SEP52333.1 hypothetical protein SAMN04489732_119215 [Amycolatopsis saalfeldensis]